MIRPATSADAEAMRQVERAAGVQFVDVGMAFVAEHEPIDAVTLASYAADGRSWVATDDEDQPVGYLIVDSSGHDAHIEQVSVDPRYQGRGIGRGLVEEAEHWAEQNGFDGVTLTTFREVPWNLPLYEHLGYSVLREDELSAELKGIRDHETERGLDPETRVCMRKAISRTRSG